MRRRLVEHGVTDLIGFREISNDEWENLIWDYRKIRGFVCGYLMILLHLNSIGKKRFMESPVLIDLNGFHMR